MFLLEPQGNILLLESNGNIFYCKNMHRSRRGGGFNKIQISLHYTINYQKMCLGPPPPRENLLDPRMTKTYTRGTKSNFLQHSSISP